MINGRVYAANEAFPSPASPDEDGNVVYETGHIGEGYVRVTALGSSYETDTPPVYTKDVADTITDWPLAFTLDKNADGTYSWIVENGEVSYTTSIPDISENPLLKATHEDDQAYRITVRNMLDDDIVAFLKEVSGIE